MNRNALELRRKYRHVEDDVEIVLESNIKGQIYYKNDDFTLEFYCLGDLQIVTLAELKKIPTSYFKNGWLTVLSVESLDDETYATLDEILEYCGLTDYKATFTTEDFKEVLSLSASEIAYFVKKLDKKTLRQFMYYASERYQDNNLDTRTITAIEDGLNIENYFYDNFK